MNCYVASPKDLPRFPAEITKENTLFYPEHSMTTREQFYSGRPAEFHIVTDSPFLIPLYSRKEVWIWNPETKTWDNPEFQTYGSGYSRILMNIYKHDNTIPMAVYNGEITNIMGHPVKIGL